MSPVRSRKAMKAGQWKADRESFALETSAPGVGTLKAGYRSNSSVIARAWTSVSLISHPS
jgi:hypothetical protein